ncbi:unnamed protein product [Durusdinium trenchii]|uniref:Carrier domain-containing protein n=1 Tax=Durusdinium trenchii TaxID=1381693 RepID=A0ABP0HW61_9DINO
MGTTVVRTSQPKSLCPYQVLFGLSRVVKIRGFRLELGEVETVLERHPEVDAAVALLLDCDEGPELCAFVTKKSQATRATERGALRGALRRHVAEALPSYARPQRLAVMESFPLLPSGKVDRRSLQQGPRPPPLAEAAEGTIHESLDEIDWQSPSHEEEAALRQAVADLLAMVTGVVLEDTEPLGALGIDSMSAIPLAELLSAQLLQNAELPLEDLYVYNTLQSLCGYLKGRLAEMPKKPPGGGGTSTKKSGKTSGKASYAELKKSRQPKGETDGTKTAKMVPGLEACRAGDVAKLKELLLDGSFHVTTLDRFGGSGLHWAASAGHLEVCHLLVKHQALVDFADKKSGRTALHWASRQGHLEVVQWLLEHQVPVDLQTKDETTPFQLAAWGGHVHVCQWLLLQKANLNHRNSWYCLAHHFAALAGMTECCKWLQEQRVDLGATNNQGHNALHKAAYGGHAELCKWLQDEATLDPEQPDARGQSCFALARKAGFQDLIDQGWLRKNLQII